MRLCRLFRTAVALVAALLGAFAGAPARAGASAPADLLIVDARVYAPSAALSGSGRPPDAVAVRGERIVAVGESAALVARYRGPGTRVVEARGRTLLPGLQDGHVHFLGGALAQARVVLDGAADVPELQRRVKAWADANPAAPWVLGRGWMYAAFGAEALPHRRYLDAIVPDRPVLLHAADGHSAWANGRALELAGITRETPDPPNGIVVRDPRTGEPTGALKEAAIGLVGKLVPRPTRDEQLAALRAAVRQASAFGLARLHSLGGDFPALELLGLLERDGDLSVRFDVAISVGPPGLTPAQRQEILAARGRWSGDALAFGGVKLMLDGVIDAKTAALLEPYADDTRRGDLFWRREDFLRTVAELDALGVPMATHAIGDASIRLALDAYEAAARANGPWRGRGVRRHKIEHVETIALADVGRFRALDVTASFQPLHANPEPGWIGVWERNLGPVRTERGFAWALLERAGARVAFGSDFPVVTLDPWQGLQMAVARQYVGADGTPLPPGGFVPAQRLTLPQALDAYTINVAQALNRDADEGSIAPGKRADLVLVDRDLAATPPLELAATRVLMTVFDGRVVHEAR
ncbi:MAG: amidohydrolase [Pseudomonadota bacterium]